MALLQLSLLLSTDSESSPIIDRRLQHYDATNAYFTDQTTHRFRQYCSDSKSSLTL